MVTSNMQSYKQWSTMPTYIPRTPRTVQRLAEAVCCPVSDAAFCSRRHSTGCCETECRGLRWCQLFAKSSDESFVLTASWNVNSASARKQSSSRVTHFGVHFLGEAMVSFWIVPGFMEATEMPDSRKSGWRQMIDDRERRKGTIIACCL